ncbi:MAG TPA: hypothetical protein VIK96_05035 [Bacilli bacterium]
MKKEQDPKEKIDNYYDLKSEAVEELASALKQDPNEVPAVVDKNIPNPYKIDRLAGIPTWIKALFIKYWVAGVICYFGLWGLGLSLTDALDQVFFLGIFTGAVTDLMVNTGFRYFESDRKEFHKYMMLPVASKKLWTLFVNFVYGILVTFVVFQIYAWINYLIVKAKSMPENSIFLGVEPLLYGLFFLIVDMFFISIKNLIVFLFRKRINK